MYTHTCTSIPCTHKRFPYPMHSALLHHHHYHRHHRHHELCLCQTYRPVYRVHGPLRLFTHTHTHTPYEAAHIYHIFVHIFIHQRPLTPSSFSLISLSSLSVHHAHSSFTHTQSFMREHACFHGDDLFSVFASDNSIVYIFLYEPHTCIFPPLTPCLCLYWYVVWWLVLWSPAQSTSPPPRTLKRKPKLLMDFE